MHENVHIFSQSEVHAVNNKKSSPPTPPSGYKQWQRQQQKRQLLTQTVIAGKGLTHSQTINGKQTEKRIAGMIDFLQSFTLVV